jgi:hypothetical protein
MECDLYSAQGIKMKPQNYLILLLVVGLSGCLLESVRPVDRHIKPYRDYWNKAAMTDEGRKADWVACGGSENGNFSWDSRRMLPGETNDTSRLRQSSGLKACLTQRGYHYEIDRD